MQRKRHLAMWVVLGLLMALGLFTAVSGSHEASNAASLAERLDAQAEAAP